MKYYKIKGELVPQSKGMYYATINDVEIKEHREDVKLYGVVLHTARTLDQWNAKTEEEQDNNNDESPNNYVYQCGSGCLYGNLGDWCTNCQTECR